MLLPCFIRIAFRVMGVARTQAMLRAWSGRFPSELTRCSPARAIDEVCLAQGRIRRNLGIGGTCLVRSLTLWAMLRRRGVETDIRIGMRKTGERAEGHAWLEYGGHPINESLSVVSSYAALPQPAAFDCWRQLR